MRYIFTLLLLIQSVFAFAANDGLVLRRGKFEIVIAENEAAPVRLAAQTLQRDFQTVMGFKPGLVSSPAGKTELR